jgi:hypothetical protein
VDIIKGLLTMPGVNTAGEASVGFNVRGGAADQNLILMDQNTLFNPSHLFGFFSAINSDMVQGVELYKSGIPASLGGRLSSVLQVTPKKGRSDKIGGSGGIGPMTSRLSLEGPIGEKTTFILGSRLTYSDWLLDYISKKTDLGASRAAFSDFNGTVEHELGPKDKLRLSGYFSKDSFQFDPDTVYSYSNQNYALSWTHYFNDALEATVPEWLAPYLDGVRTWAQLEQVDWHDALFSLVPWNLRAPLDRLAPTHMDVPSGSRITINYTEPTAPVLAVKLQEVFGWTSTPMLFDGRVPLTMHLLSPAQRPVQVTRDLAGFWKSSYFDVRTELRGRYPRHPWPDDPLTATATRRAKPRGT